jgi:fatty aldehyde-generating acyl-ACP reductase
MRSRFAFLIHPRTNIAEDLASVHPLLGKVPNDWYEKALAKLPIKPWVQNQIIATDTGEVLGECIVVPLTPAQLLGRDRKLVDLRINQAIELAQKRGAQLIGLGALTAPATSGGRKLAKREDIGVTNGNAFTASATVEAIQRTAASLDRAPRIALVGATGSVGAAVTKTLAELDFASSYVLIGRNQKKLAELAAVCGEGRSLIAQDMSACADADIVVLMTSATDTLLQSEHLKQNAIVIDDTQPRNTSPELLEQRPDILLIDGGLVATEGLNRKGRTIGLPANISFACLAETALLALSGHRGHGVIGDPSLEQVHRMRSIADDNQHLGFHLAAPTAFGTPVSVAGWAAA